MVKRTAKAVVLFCDFMNGYIGQEIQNAVADGIMIAPIIYGMIMMMVFLSR